MLSIHLQTSDLQVFYPTSVDKKLACQSWTLS
uniref:Uncharacterized protein n=1 Tax=Anguilla anguilla TaxID=7936 RepID=A0A0E9UW32_ANGAN